MEQTQEQFKAELSHRSQSHDWDCAIAGCVLKSVRRRTHIRASACVLVVAGFVSGGIMAAGGVESTIDTVAEFFVPEALHPMRSINEPLMTPDMDLLIQVALRE